MLDAGGVLGLVHHEILEPGPPGRQDVGPRPEDLQSIDHLIVVVHPGIFPQKGAVGVINPEKAVVLPAFGPDVPVGLHPVFAEGDAGPGLLDLALGGVILPRPAKGIPDKAGGLPLPVQETEGRSAGAALILPDDPGADAVDGVKGQAGCRLFPKHGGKAPAHILGGRHSIGHGEDALGLHSPAVDETADPCQQHRCLAAPRHRQKQNRPLGLAHRRLLLGIQLEAKGLAKAEEFHRFQPLWWKMRLLSRAKTRSEKAPRGVFSSVSR